MDSTMQRISGMMPSFNAQMGFAPAATGSGTVTSGNNVSIQISGVILLAMIAIVVLARIVG